MRYREVQYNFIIIIVFLIWPLLGFLLYLVLARQVTNKSFLFVIFYGYIGFSFLINNPALDSYRYAEQFESLSYANSYAESVKSGILDLYTFITMRIVSFCTHDVHYLFALWGGILGYFIASTFNIMKKVTINRNVPVLCFIITLTIAMLNTPLGINAVRFWTASAIALAGLLDAEVLSRKRGGIFILVTPLVHTSFLLFVIIYLLYRIIKINQISTLKIVFILSYVISLTLSATSLAGIISQYLGPVNHFMAYLDSTYINQTESLAATKSTLNVILTSLPMVLMIIYVLMIKEKNILMNEVQKKILVFFLIYMSIINILSVIPHIFRFNILGYSIFLFLIYIRQDAYKYRVNVILSMIILVSFLGTIFVRNEFLPEVLDINILMPSFFK